MAENPIPEKRMKSKIREAFINIINSNIDKYGFHVYAVTGGPLPTYAYTIGLKSTIGHELIIAGASYYSLDETRQIINDIAEAQRIHPKQLIYELHSFGSFGLESVDASWRGLIIGALDFFGSEDVAAYQIVPNSLHRTVDTPSLNVPWSPATEPIWEWLYNSWTKPFPATAAAATNLAALQGELITEAMRWEADEWEVFAGSGPDVNPEDARFVPLATLIGFDSSLEDVADLEVGKGIWRDPSELAWHRWE